MRIWIFTAALFLFPAVLPASGPVNSAGPLSVRSVPRTPGTHSSIRVDVDMTLVPVTVVDPIGRNVTGLRPDNFLLFDGKNSRPIVSFSRQDAPVSVGIILDSSGSMRHKLNAARRAVQELFKQLNPEDEALLITVSGRAEIKSSLVSDPSSMANTLMFGKAGGLTPLVDGIYLALQRMRHAHNPRKALVVVSDGGDNNSRYTLRELLSYASECDTQIYTIGLLENPQSPEEAEGPELLKRLAGHTGGRAFAVRGETDMRDSMARIGITLHNQYVLGYYPPGDVPPGKYRKIRVELRVPRGTPQLQVYARRGYYAPLR